MVFTSRNTRQKEIIQKEITNTEKFFTAEELYEKVRTQDTKIGIATIYRYLKEETKKRNLHEYLCERKKLYSKEKNNHCHFTCETCGNMKHINIKSLDFVKDNVPGSICHFQIDVNGICEECLKK